MAQKPLTSLNVIAEDRRIRPPCCGRTAISGIFRLILDDFPNPSASSMTHRNQLADETSPYLLQHSENPVDWRAWNPEALETAHKQDKPILLSVGYSACHWCHVMAHESFEDAETARLMNKNFINIKVDREERPDVDKIYQTAHQLLTRHAGGWPLTVFLTPGELTPFYSGTYFPREARHGLPAFPDILEHVADFYRDHRKELQNQAAPIREAFSNLNPTPVTSDTDLDSKPLAAAREQLEQDFDPRFGGFGRAPKFPHPSSIDRLLRHWRGTLVDPEPDLRALYMASLTLRRMAHGGVYDQLGGGFCRYSVDDYWMIPHFEKMLYDNGQLLGVYAQAWQATGESLYHRIADGIADWVLRDMQAGTGGYFSTLDADSEGEEGRFYVWDVSEIRQALSDDEFTIATRRYGLDSEPNFEGRWHLHVNEQATHIAKMLDIDETEVRNRLDSVNTRLLKLRSKRVAPDRDEKILTAWNGLMIRGMAIAGRVLERDDLLESAMNAADFIHRELWHDGRLLAASKNGRAHLPAYLDDYANLIDGLLELVQSAWDSDTFDWILELAEVMLEHFEDTADGGFFFTADDHERLLCRPKSFSDDAVPAGNGIAAQVLGRLGHITGKARFLYAAERTLRASWLALQRVPHAHTSLLGALEDYLEPVEIVVIRGDGDNLGGWHRNASATYAPQRVVFAIPGDAGNLPAGLRERTAADQIVAYICRGTECSAPVRSLEALTNALKPDREDGPTGESSTHS